MKRRFASILMCFALIFVSCLSDVKEVFAFTSTTITFISSHGNINFTGTVINSYKDDQWSDKSVVPRTIVDNKATIQKWQYSTEDSDFHAILNPSARSVNVGGIMYYVKDPELSSKNYTYEWEESDGSDESLGPYSGLILSFSETNVQYYPTKDYSLSFKTAEGLPLTGAISLAVQNNITGVSSSRASGSGGVSGMRGSNSIDSGCEYTTKTMSGTYTKVLPTGKESTMWSESMAPINGHYYYLLVPSVTPVESTSLDFGLTPFYVTYNITCVDAATQANKLVGLTLSTVNEITGKTVTATTNANGTATFTLPWKVGGTSAGYVFKSTIKPDGYKNIADQTVYQNTSTAPTQTASVNSFTRSAMTVTSTFKYAVDDGGGGGPQITVSAKETSTAEPINGATFTVKNSSGAVISTLVTNAIGEATVTGIETGTYTVTQTGTGADYNFTASSQSVTVDSSGVYAYFTNARKTGAITFYIKDSAGTAISGAKFILSGNGTNTQYTTSSTGAIALTGIRYGPYVLTEYDIPSGYVPKNLYVEFTLNNSTNGTSYTYNYNKVTAPTTYGDITINLYDSSTGIGIKGGTFQVKNSSNTVVATVVTNAIGTVAVSNLPVGTYTVTQTVAALYYTNEAATNTVTLTTYGSNTNFTNTRQTGTLSIYLKDTTGSKYVSGAQFILSGGGTLNTQTSTSAGLLTFSGVRLGEEYNITEYVIPSGYIPRSLSVPITMTASTAAYTYNYSEVSSASGNLIINLYDDATGVGIKGGTFQVKNSTGAIVTTVTTNAIGTVSIDNLTVGTYTVTQVATSSFYANSGGTNSVNLAINGTSTNFTNSRLTGTIYVYMKDITGSKSIANSQFLLTGNGANNLQTANSSGLITFNDVRRGEPYQLVEYYIPSGYVCKNMAVSITLTSPSASYTYNYAVSDDWRPPTIEFASLPADNSVDKYYCILTLTDNQSGVKELRIDGMSVFVQPTSEALSVSYTQEIYMNGTYKYELIDYAGNIYTTTKTVKCIANSPLYVNSMTLSNYKSKVDYDGELVYVVNSSYPYSNVNFSISDEDPDDAWTYKIELMTLSSSVLYTNSGSLNRVGNHTARVQYQNETTGSRLDDGIYIITLTAGDGKMLISKSCKVIVKNSYPPKPIINFTDSSETVSIQYPTDLFEGYSSKEYCYLDGLCTYANSFKATENGMVTATYTDIAGNKTSTALYVSIPRKLEDGESGTPLPSIADNDSSITGLVIEEDNNFIVYYIGIRSVRGKETEDINELLTIIR